MLDQGPVLWVDTPEKVAEVCAKVQEVGLLALDIEADSLHVYRAKTCLIQLTFAETHVLIDPLVLSREELSPLGSILSNPKIRKIAHGADYDVRMLQKDLAFVIKNLADTQLAAQVLGEPQTSLAALVAKELQVQLDKDLQRANWALRPLSPEMVAYATADSRYLEPLFHRLLHRLEKLGRTSWWLEECAFLEQVVFEPPVANPWAFLKIKGARSLPPSALGRLASLWQFREQLAQDLDLPPFRVLPSETLLRLAQEAPPDLPTLAKTPGVHGRLVRRWGREILRILRESQDATVPKAPVRFDPARERLVTKLRKVRDQVAHKLELEPGFLAPRAALEAVAENLPQTDEQWLACLRRRWRVAVLKEDLGKALSES